MVPGLTFPKTKPLRQAWGEAVFPGAQSRRCPKTCSRMCFPETASWRGRNGTAAGASSAQFQRGCRDLLDCRHWGGCRPGASWRSVGGSCQIRAFATSLRNGDLWVGSCRRPLGGVRWGHPRPAAIGSADVNCCRSDAPAGPKTTDLQVQTLGKVFTPFCLLEALP